MPSNALPPFLVRGIVRSRSEIDARAVYVHLEDAQRLRCCGGLTVIANAPNPAGQSILQRFFEDGISPLHLALGALVPTTLMGIAYMVIILSLLRRGPELASGGADIGTTQEERY